MDTTPRRRDALLLALLAALPFVRSLAFGFIFDDTTIVRSNPALRAWSTIPGLWSQPYWANGGHDASGLYRPLLMTWFAIIWKVGHGFPILFHLAAVAAHVAVTLMLWRLLRRATTGTTAILAAAWFAIQPVHVEAVANIANSSEVYVALITLGLCFLMMRIDASTPIDGSVDYRSALAVMVLAAAAALTKESGLMTPVLGLLVVWGWKTPLGGAARTGAQIRRWRAVIGGIALVWIGVMVARHLVLGGLVGGSSVAAAGLEHLSTTQRLWAMLALGPKIVALLVWAEPLNPFYGPSYLAGHISVAVLFVLAALLYGMYAFRRARDGDRRLIVAAGWIFIAFLPASNLLTPTGQVLAERTLYVPSIGAAMLLAVCIEALVRWVGARGDIRRWERPGILAACGALIVGGVFTTSRVGIWGNHERLFRQMIVADSESYRGYWLLGMAQRYVQHPDSALELLGRAYQLYPNERQLNIDYAETLLQNGRAREAIVPAAGLLQTSESRSPAAVGLYLEAVRQGLGVDSLIARGTPLWRNGALPIEALYLGDAYAVKRDFGQARSMFEAGLQRAGAEPEVAKLLRERIGRLE